MKTILVLAANPKDTPPLRLDKEVREIGDGLRQSTYRDELRLETKPAARIEDLRRAMLNYHPDIVHFCGHGARKEGLTALEEGILLEDDCGNSIVVGAEALSGFFELFADELKCVVLNACYTEVQANAIARHIDYVIGMKQDIEDSVAIAFAVAFYDAIGAGRPIDFAYNLARNAIHQLANVPEDLIPVLIPKAKPSQSVAKKTRDQKKTLLGQSVEGIIINIVLVENRSANQAAQLIKELPINISALEWIECKTNQITLFLPRQEQKLWSNLSQQALQIALSIAAEIPGAAIALHIEHEGSRVGNLIAGKEIDFAYTMLPTPLKPYIFLSGEILRSISDVVSDPKKLAVLLPKKLEGKPVTAELSKLIAIPRQKWTYSQSQATHDVYNLYLLAENGELLLGDMDVPADSLSIDFVDQKNNQLLEQRLVNFERISIVGVTNENLVQYLDAALKRRKEAGKEFWEELRIVFLARELLPSVLDYRYNKFDLPKANEDRYLGWGRGVREVREFLLGCGPIVSSQWECLQFNYMLPFEAQRFGSSQGDSLIHLIPLLPNSGEQEGYFIETTYGFLHTQFSSAVDAIMRTATPIVEFNVYGHVNKSKGFVLGGVVSQREWRDFKPPEGEKACFPVALILLYADVGGCHRVFLQKRTIFNTGGDFDVYSLISGKVNDEDFFLPDLPSLQYRQRAYELSSVKNDNLRQQLSKMFAAEKRLIIGQTISQNIMKNVWVKTAVRELNAELGIQADAEKLIDCPCPPILDRGEFQLYVNLFALELQPEEIAQIQRVRPNANLNSFDLEKLIEFNNASPTKLNHFLNVNFNEIILPLLSETIGVK
jgi:hypothetical protein